MRGEESEQYTGRQRSTVRAPERRDGRCGHFGLGPEVLPRFSGARWPAFASTTSRDEGGVINAGEVQWMTAGRGIIHGENVATKGRVRLLQLWLTLPKAHRWTTPAFQDIHANDVAVR